MPTFSDDRITFIHIPKTAGSSVTRWYLRNINKTASVYNHESLSEIETPAPITFAIVRNPWDRMLSMYLFTQLYIDESLKTDFNEFVLYKVKESYYDNRSVTTPQIRWIEPGVTHLLRFENIIRDFKIIQNIFKCYESLPLTNKTKHGDYRTYYNDETRAAVAEMFKEDIEAFGYEF
jgi:hypothetical protein